MQKQKPEGNAEGANSGANLAHFANQKSRLCFVFFALLGMCWPSVARAQSQQSVPKVINIWPGAAPGSEQWTQKETTLRVGRAESIVNVTTPTLTAYLPDPANATGTAVIIASGGGFISLGTDTHEVAEWLAGHGIAGFVLKYRTGPSPGRK